jgi:hypothetical protein
VSGSHSARVSEFSRKRWAVVAIAVFAGGGAAATACAPGPRQTSFRSPSYDYPAPAHELANGDTLGADRQTIDDKLKTGTRVGNDGVHVPGWKVENGKPVFASENLAGEHTSNPADRLEHEETDGGEGGSPP